ncbi:MAG TPA: heme-binding protein [Bryobacteraceae bacterium]|nr:heme-binding protein [Bryobacteraceae bacterium]
MSDIRKVCHNLTLAGARQVRDCALQKASELRAFVSVVVVDRAGVVLLAETADNAPPGSWEASLMKAKGAAKYRIATHVTAEFVKTLPPALAQHALSLPGVCAFQGGVPIRLEGEVLGGVGVSGGSGEQDVAIALAAAESIEKQ